MALVPVGAAVNAITRRSAAVEGSCLVCVGGRVRRRISRESPAAVNHDGLPGDEGRVIGGEEGQRPGEVFRRFGALDRLLPSDHLEPAELSGLPLIVVSVRVNPGERVLTVCPKSPTAEASDRANPIKPPLLAV